MKRKEEFFFESTLPFIINLALRAPQLFPDPIPYLITSFPTKLIVLSREQVACLLAQNFLGLFSDKFFSYPTRIGFNNWDMINIFRTSHDGHMGASARCIMNYFLEFWRLLLKLIC